jgi:hypothetical protein
MKAVFDPGWQYKNLQLPLGNGEIALLGPVLRSAYITCQLDTTRVQLGKQEEHIPC